MSRGKCGLRGGGARFACHGIAAAAYNVRIVRAFFEEIEKNTGVWPANDHPRCQRHPEHHGFDHLADGGRRDRPAVEPGTAQ